MGPLQLASAVNVVVKKINSRGSSWRRGSSRCCSWTPCTNPGRGSTVPARIGITYYESTTQQTPILHPLEANGRRGTTHDDERDAEE